MKKDIEWLKGRLRMRKLFKPQTEEEIGYNKAIDEFSEYVDQLGRARNLSEEWLDKNKCSWMNLKTNGYSIPVEKIQNLLAPKQEEVDRAYKDGYEKGKQHTFYKGYLEGLADKESEPETVADVIADFFKSLEQLKEVMSMEVEELEE